MPKPTPRCLPSSLVVTREHLEQLTEEERAIMRKHLEPDQGKANELWPEDSEPAAAADSLWFIDTEEVRKILGIPW